MQFACLLGTRISSLCLSLIPWVANDSDGDGGFLIVLRLGCSVSGSQAQVWIDCPTDEEKKRKRTPRTTTIPSWASGSCRLKTAVLDGVTVFQYPTPAVVSCMLYAVLDAARVTGDWRYLPAHSVCCAFASPAGPCANELGECGRRRPYIALGRICTLQYRCLRGLNSTRGHVSNRSTLPGKREGSA